jgi:hypothetical protein
MKFGEKVIYGSTEDVKTHLHEMVSQLNDNLSEMQISGEFDYVKLSLRGLTIYTDTLLGRLISYKESPIEFCALTARSLFECYLVIAFILSDPPRAKEFLGLKASEELEINEGFLYLTKPSTPEEIKKTIHHRMDYIKQVMEKDEIALKRPWPVKYLAEQTNNKLEYQAFFKLYSKYVHPSSWIVNSSINEYGNPVFRNIFLLQGQHYASCIIKLVSNYQREQAIA